MTEFNYRKAKVEHRGREATIEDVCVDCDSYMKHTGAKTQKYKCNCCGHESERVHHVGINSAGEEIVRLTKQARSDIKKHYGNTACKLVRDYKGKK